MKTKKCKYCGEEIAKKVKKCPKCGGKYGLPVWAKLLIVLGVILVFVVACTASCTKAVDDAVEESFGGYDDQKWKTSFNIGETFKSKHLKVTFDSSNPNFTNYDEYATVKDGYKVVDFKFTAENIGEKNEMIDYYDFECYADDQKMQQFYLTEDAGFQGGEISSGKTVKITIYCEVPKNSSKVFVEYKPMTADKNYKFNSK